MRGRRVKREQVYEMALEFFALNQSGHIYGVKSALGKKYYYSSVFQAVKNLKADGFIYQIDEERAVEGKPPRKIYQLSCLGLIEALKRRAFIIIKDIALFNEVFVKKALETHRRLCPAIFPRLVNLDDVALQSVVRSIIKYGERYFYDADLDSMGLEELDVIAPLVFCSMIYDAICIDPSLTLVSADRQIFGREFSLGRDSFINLTAGQVQNCFLMWCWENKVEDPFAFIKWIEEVKPHVEDPEKLLSTVVDLKQKFYEYELERIKRVKNSRERL